MGGAEVKARRVPPALVGSAPRGCSADAERGLLASDPSTPRGLDVLSLHGTGEFAAAWLSIAMCRPPSSTAPGSAGLEVPAVLGDTGAGATWTQDG